MIHKIRNFKDLEKQKGINKRVRQSISEFINVFEKEYGSDGKGGHVLYAEKGASIEEIKAIFSYDLDTIEFIEKSIDEPYTYTICFLVGTEFSIVLIMYEDDAPDEFKRLCKEEALENGG